MSDKKQTVDLGLLEEDDEFEEFPAEGEQDWRLSEVLCAACLVSLFVADRNCRGFFVSAGPRYSDSASISTSSSSLIHCDYYELVSATRLKLPTRAAGFPVFEYLTRVISLIVCRFLLPYQCSSVSMLT